MTSTVHGRLRNHCERPDGLSRPRRSLMLIEMMDNDAKMKQRKLIISHEERGQRSQSGRQRVPTRYTSGPTTAGTRRRDRRNRELLPTKGQEKQNGSYQATLNDRSLLSTPTRTRGQRLGKKNRYSHYTHYQRRAQTGPAAGNRFLVHRDLAFLQITPQD